VRKMFNEDGRQTIYRINPGLAAPMWDIPGVYRRVGPPLAVALRNRECEIFLLEEDSGSFHKMEVRYGKGMARLARQARLARFWGLEGSRSALPTRCPRQCAFPPTGFASTSDLANTPSPQAVTLKTRVPRSPQG
jgi:hypothetical protein